MAAKAKRRAHLLFSVETFNRTFNNILKEQNLI
jgi:hypothetical protein